jgi:serine/threonine protein kinase
MATFGRYEILDKLGEGAMGVVYRARDTTLGRVVALKMLSADLVADAELHQRFLREAEAIGGLNHPNIVTVYDLGESEGLLYMAMELLDGDDLRSLIERKAEIPLPDKVRLLLQICDGLGYAHTKGVVHRDIKPANIIVTAGGHAKLLDFGLARVATRATITKRGVILGTPDYMSPEQATGRTLDHRTDIFSAGAVFYEALTLQKPFKGKTLHAVLYQIISEDPEPVLTLNPDLPARLASLVQRMLEKEPTRRFAHMTDVGQELRSIHHALRRSKGLSALPQEDSHEEDIPRRLRDHMGLARGHVEAGRFRKAIVELNDALALDPDSDDAAELLWRSVRHLQGARSEVPPNPENAARVKALLERLGPGKSDAEARRAIAELALIAPDDRQVMEVLRERSGRLRPASGSSLR